MFYALAVTLFLTLHVYGSQAASENCDVNPEQAYQSLMQKPSLNQEEQRKLLELEKQLSLIAFLNTYDPPKCIKNNSWKIDFKTVEARMMPYRYCCEGGQWIDWNAYSNPKIQKDGAAYIIQTFAEYLGEEGNPMYLNVPGQHNCDGCDGGSKSEVELSKFLEESCKKHSDQAIRQTLRKRTIAILKKMDSSTIRAEGDEDPTPTQKKKIVQERKRIRSQITDVLNKHCF